VTDLAPGDTVRVKTANPDGNPRTPRYTRGKVGQVVGRHGQMHNPLDHRGVYPPLFTVAFAVQDVFGTPGRDRLFVDLHADWLEPA
jgi:nitrile hydratase subunit beta